MRPWRESSNLCRLPPPAIISPCRTEKTAMPDLEELQLRNEERYADIWGLSSLLMSGFLVIPAPILIFMTSYLWTNFPRAVPPQFARLLFYFAVGAMVAVVLVS